MCVCDSLSDFQTAGEGVFVGGDKQAFLHATVLTSSLSHDLV